MDCDTRHRTKAKVTARVPVIYTMGKVGSDAIAKSYEAAGLAAYHIHTLDDEQLKKTALTALQRDMPPPGHISTSLYLKRRPLGEFRWVSSVREPMARNLSAFFQNLDSFGGRADMPAEDAAALFLQAYRHDLPLTWFDREWKAALDIDVYSVPFDYDRKAALFAKAVVFRVDCPDHDKSQLIGNMTGQNVPIKPGNVTAEKTTGGLYEETKRLVKVPTGLIDRLYDSKYARHFWTEEENRAFASRWAG